jgi:hypothetical protein
LGFLGKVTTVTTITTPSLIVLAGGPDFKHLVVTCGDGGDPLGNPKPKQ